MQPVEPAVTTPDRAAAVVTAATSLIDAVGAGLALLPLAFGLVYYLAWGEALNSGSAIEYWPVWALLLAFVVALFCAVCWAVGAVLLLRHRELGRRLIILASGAAVVGFIAAWTTPAAEWGGFDALMYVLFAALPLVLALLPGTKRWCG